MIKFLKRLFITNWKMSLLWVILIILMIIIKDININVLLFFVGVLGTFGIGSYNAQLDDDFVP